MITLEMLQALKVQDIIDFARTNNIKFIQQDCQNCAIAIIGKYFGYSHHAYQILMNTSNKRNKEVFIALDKIENGFEGFNGLSDPEDPFYQFGVRLSEEVINHARNPT